jgi:GNAT superfamily N-acetyltransferase
MLSEDFFFQITYSFTSFPQSSAPGEDPTDFVTDIFLDIRKPDERGENNQKIGRGYISLIHFSLAMDEGYPLEYVMDASDSILKMSEELFDMGEEVDYMDKITEYYDGLLPVNFDVCFIERLELLPDYRGKGLGRWVIKNILERFYGSCGLVVAHAFPVQHEEGPPRRGEEMKWEESMQYQLMEQDPEMARYQLYHFYQKLGFTNPFGEDYFIIRPHDFNFDQFDVDND